MAAESRLSGGNRSNAMDLPSILLSVVLVHILAMSLLEQSFIIVTRCAAAGNRAAGRLIMAGRRLVLAR
jgi:hypothetical protein